MEVKIIVFMNDLYDAELSDVGELVAAATTNNRHNRLIDLDPDGVTAAVVVWEGDKDVSDRQLAKFVNQELGLDDDVDDED